LFDGGIIITAAQAIAFWLLQFWQQLSPIYCSLLLLADQKQALIAC